MSVMYVVTYVICVWYGMVWSVCMHVCLFCALSLSLFAASGYNAAVPQGRCLYCAVLHCVILLYVM